VGVRLRHITVEAAHKAVEGRAWQEGALHVKMEEPYTVAGNPSGRSEGVGNDPISRRARLAIKARSNPKEQFTNLLHHMDYKLVEECLNKIPRKSASGVDGMKVSEARKNLDWLLPPLLQQIHQGQYEAPPVRRVYIPKADGGKRPLGVPQVLDRAIQAAMARVLNEIYEQDFLKCSFGFRPKLGCHHALATVNELLFKEGMNYALEVDIRDFFGSLKHEWLRKFLSLRIGDKRVLKLIESWLKAGVMEDNKWKESEDGTPQGGSISPVLANVYLHYVLDLWFERKIKKQLKGRASLVRYADDFVILFTERADLDTVKSLLTARLGQFGLSIAEEKTHMTDLTNRPNQGSKDRRRMTFLGFSIFRSRDRAGKRSIVVFKTDGKRFTRAKLKLKQRLRKIMHLPVEAQAASINSFLVGHYNYYGVAGNIRRMQRLWYHTRRMWRRSLSQRSQKGRVNWEQMATHLAKHPLKPARIKITYQQLPSYVRL
jgi:RNA-directed DNA polymerase